MNARETGPHWVHSVIVWDIVELIMVVETGAFSLLQVIYFVINEVILY